MTPLSPLTAAWTRSKPPLLRFLDNCLNEFSAETSGHVADYIPELSKADPAYFGISLATLDGHVYEVGDSRVPFTIQSMSKPFVFALALDLLGAGKVESAIGVEPSGDPFNSIRLNSENHPFNPMVNAGAIACTGLIYDSKGAEAFEQIRLALSRFAGRDLAVDDLISLVGAVDGILQAQSAADVEYFARIASRGFSAVEVADLKRAVLGAYRWQYILSGAEHPHFQKVLMDHTTEAQQRRIGAALAPLT